jgi:hypothetical protein
MLSESMYGFGAISYRALPKCAPVGNSRSKGSSPTWGAKSLNRVPTPPFPLSFVWLRWFERRRCSNGSSSVMRNPLSCHVASLRDHGDEPSLFFFVLFPESVASVARETRDVEGGRERHSCRYIVIHRP